MQNEIHFFNKQTVSPLFPIGKCQHYKSLILTPKPDSHLWKHIQANGSKPGIDLHQNPHDCYLLIIGKNVF